MFPVAPLSVYADLIRWFTIKHNFHCPIQEEIQHPFVSGASDAVILQFVQELSTGYCVKRFAEIKDDNIPKQHFLWDGLYLSTSIYRAVW